MFDKSSELINNYSKLSENVKNNFYANLESDFKFNTHFLKREFDFSWLDIMEDATTYIDNILMNPKMFILNNEEIVVVEKSKKVSVESVVHLTQHSNFISEYNPKTGDIRPSKILNITREETMDIYENRFIYTLINHMSMFLEKYGVLALEGSSSINNKNLVYTAKTKSGDESINIKLNIDSIENKTSKLNSKSIAINDRIEVLRNKVNSFRHSLLYKTLASLKVPEVKSPIKKTNVILKNPNFVKAESLWYFLETFDKNIKKESKYTKNYSDNTLVNEDLDFSFLINYALIKNVTERKNDEAVNLDDINNTALKNIIENYLTYNTFISEEKFIKLVSDEYKKIRKDQQKKFEAIETIIVGDLNQFNINKNKALDILKI